MTIRLQARLSDGQIDSTALKRAAALLGEGKLVAFPTETVYGLGAHALDVQAVARIFEAKQRPRFNPLIIHVPDLAAAKGLSAGWPAEATVLAQCFWPGPLTLVLPRAGHVPDMVSAGLDTVAIRVPQAEVALELLRLTKLPLAAPSANPYSAVSPTRAEHVLEGLEGRIDAVLDDGAASVGIESTVVDLSQGEPLMLRAGAVSLEDLEECLGRKVLVVGGSAGSEARPSPGMSRRHYSPDAEVWVVSEGELSRLLSSFASKEKVGGVFRSAEAPNDARIVGWERLGSDAADFARELYAALFRLQKAGATVILLEKVPETGLWRGVADRIRRAAAR